VKTGLLETESRVMLSPTVNVQMDRLPRIEMVKIGKGIWRGQCYFCTELLNFFSFTVVLGGGTL
jgi:hypothetical protein